MTNANTISINRTTGETKVAVQLGMAGRRQIAIDTGIGFFDHMLTSMAFWAGWDLTLSCKGDLNVDTHHTVEDTAIVLGQAIRETWVTRNDITRFGEASVPLDEALSQVVLDLSNRPYTVFNATLPQERVGEFETVMAKHFFTTLATEARITLHIRNFYGENSHHILESIFKAVGLAIKQALIPATAGVASTKGKL